MSETGKTKWVSARIGNDTYKTVLTTDTHEVIADEPIDVGGADTGPSPGDLLRMSLASCTAITLRMYANRKGFPVDDIEVRVFSEEVNGKTLFHTKIRIRGKTDSDQADRMMRIARRCPIHKLLTHPIEIATTFEQANPEQEG